MPPRVVGQLGSGKLTPISSYLGGIKDKSPLSSCHVIHELKDTLQISMPAFNEGHHFERFRS